MLLKLLTSPAHYLMCTLKCDYNQNVYIHFLAVSCTIWLSYIFGEGGTSANVFSSIKAMFNFFGGYCPNPPPPPFIKNLMVCPWDAVRSYNFLCDERIWICMYHSRCFFYITERISSDNFRKLEATTKGFLSKRGAIFSQTWSNTLKTERGTQAVYC